MKVVQMSEQPTETCEFCRYWEKIQPKLGECRRNAPTLVMAVLTDKASIPNKAAWPRTFGVEWCGDFAFHPDVSDS